MRFVYVWFCITVGSENYWQACAKKYFAGQRPAVCVGARGIMSAPRDHEFSKTVGLLASPKALGRRIQKILLWPKVRSAREGSCIHQGITSLVKLSAFWQVQKHQADVFKKVSCWPQASSVCVCAHEGSISSPRDHGFSKTGSLQASLKALGARLQKTILLVERQQRVCAHEVS